MTGQPWFTPSRSSRLHVFGQLATLDRAVLPTFVIVYGLVLGEWFAWRWMRTRPGLSSQASGNPQWAPAGREAGRFFGRGKRLHEVLRRMPGMAACAILGGGGALMGQTRSWILLKRR